MKKFFQNVGLAVALFGCLMFANPQQAMANNADPAVITGVPLEKNDLFKPGIVYFPRTWDNVQNAWLVGFFYYDHKHYPIYEKPSGERYICWYKAY